MSAGRGWAYAALISGGIVSAVFNVTYQLINPGPLLWLMVIVSGTLPVFLGIGIELAARFPWRRTVVHVLARWVGVLPLAIILAYVSWEHGQAVLLRGGATVLTAYAWPLAYDGLMIMGTVALLLTRTVATEQGVRTVRPTAAERVRAARTAYLDVRTAAFGERTQYDPAERTAGLEQARTAGDAYAERVRTRAAGQVDAVREPQSTPVRVRKPAAPWDRTAATALINDTILTDRQIAAKVSLDPGNPVSHTSVYRLRESLRKQAAESIPAE